MTYSHACPRPRTRQIARAIGRCIALACALACAPARAEAPSLDAARLLGAFATMPGLEARFVEEKQLALLAKPLVSEGVLYFTRPGLLLRRVTKPLASEVLVTPTRVRLTDAGGTKTLELRARPDLQPFVQSLVWILTGDHAALTRTFALTFAAERDGQPWTLTLVPRAAPLTHLFKQLRILGQGLRVSQIEVEETSGDRSVTRILDANPARQFASAERAALFGPDAP